jgi:hypothetical protein
MVLLSFTASSARRLDANVKLSSQAEPGVLLTVDEVGEILRIW